MKAESSIQSKGTFMNITRYLIPTLFLLPLLLLATSSQVFSEENANPDIVLADFKQGIPCSQCGDNLGYRSRDVAQGELVQDGAAGTLQSARFHFDGQEIDLYYQGDVRRKYLSTGTPEYVEQGHNALSFWVKIPEGSPLFSREREIRSGDRVIGRKVEPGAVFNVWTYHWRQGDMGVGGKSNQGRATDSNMHGYCNFRFQDVAADKWVQVVLTPKAFRQARNYYHFYAGRANTDELDFFASLRQLQIRISDKQNRPISLQLDEVKLTSVQPTVSFDREFHDDEVVVTAGEYRLPVTLSNPTDKDRSYRVFISSNLGVDRKLLSTVFGLTDAMAPMRKIQTSVGSDGGIGVVELVDKKDRAIDGPGDEIQIPAGHSWSGTLVFNIKPEMLGDKTTVNYGQYEFNVRRDTLSTSVIVWDPKDEGHGLERYIQKFPSNADDGNHKSPPGFPRQVQPPEGWRSKDIPLDQAGGNLVTVLRLK